MAEDVGRVDGSAFTIPGLSSRTGDRSPLKDLFQGSELNLGKPSNSIYFPERLHEIDHWVTFRVFKMTKLSRDEGLGKTALAYITLPLPSNLGTGYQARYEGETSGIMAALAGSGGAEGLKAIQSFIKETPTLNESGTSLLEKLRSAAKGAPGAAEVIGSIVDSIKSTPNASIAGREMSAVEAVALSKGVGAAGAVGEAALAGAFGIARNPHQVILYTGPSFRTHSFSYMLSPRNRRESDAIRSIITAFKYFQAGKYGLGGLSNQKVKVETVTGRAFFEYPEFFEIDFHYPKYLFNIGPSVLTQLSIDYHPQNVPAYVRDESGMPAPVEVSISMSFQERDIVTKDDIIDRGR